MTSLEWIYGVCGRAGGGGENIAVLIGVQSLNSSSPTLYSVILCRSGSSICELILFNVNRDTLTRNKEYPKMNISTAYNRNPINPSHTQKY